MSYHEYIFRIPADCPDLDFGSLARWTGLRHERKIGATVTVTWVPELGAQQANFEIWLYETRIACIYPGEVAFPGPDDPHMATTYWIAKIARDNAINGADWVGRIRRDKDDGPGPRVPRGRAGLLVIGGRDRPVFGHAYPVGDIAAMRQHERESRERMAVERERYAEESRRREALKTWADPALGTFHAIDDYSYQHNSYWRVVDGTFRDGGAGYHTVGYIHDTREYSSPEPADEPVFAAFAGGPEHCRDALGLFATLAGAVEAVARHEITMPAVELVTRHG